MEPLLDVVKVEARAGYAQHLEFENGEKRLFDVSPYMDEKPFAQLKDHSRFAMASITNGTVAWPGHIDIAPETLYYRSRQAE